MRPNYWVDMTDLPLIQCWHLYKPDLNGLEYCIKCGDNPDERLAEQERNMDQIFMTKDKMGDTLTIDRFVLGKQGKRKMVMARIFDEDGELQASVELHPNALIELYGMLNRHLPELIEGD